MTLAGCSIMIVSVASVTLLCAYCIYRVWTLPPHDAEEHVKNVPHDT